MGRVSERGSKIKKHKWTRKEDEALIAALSELCESGWKRDNNIFRSGYTGVLEKELKIKLPGCNLKASPHIESRLKTLKKHCDAITDIKDAIGIEWSNVEQSVVCDDDDVWEDWVKDHPDARGLRSKSFPYYDELRAIFGKNRGNQKCLENASDAEKALDVEKLNDYAGNMIVTEGFNTMKRSSGNGNLSNEPEHEEANNHTENDMGAGESNDDEVSIDDVEGAQLQMQGGSTSTKNADKKRTRSSESWSSGLEGVAKMFGTLLEKHEEQFSLLVGLVGREVAADKAIAGKRARLNGELKIIPNLSLQARLRAASMIVSDPPKLDLFYSLSNDERKEWVSMLLSGLI